MKRILFALLFLFFFGYSLAYTQPYTISSVDASDIETHQKPTVSLVCFDRDGTNMLPGEAVTLEFFKRDGTSLGSRAAVCSTDPTTPFDNAPDAFDSPGLYYVEANLDCAPGCCQSGGGCSRRDWFSVTTPFNMANIPDNGFAGALLTGLLVIFIVRERV